ncbi:hypothetical protein [Paragemmobacter aquarius]|nr:hypothetical protein [Gemmobacter aquarius]
MPEPFLPLLDRQATIRGREVVFTCGDATEAAAALAQARDRAARGEDAIATLLSIAETIEQWGKAELVDGKGIGNDLLDLADIIGAEDAARARGLSKFLPSRSQTYRDGARWALRRCIAWLHAEAASMNDPKARSVLHSAAFGMGCWKRKALEDAPDSVSRAGGSL